MIRVLLVDDIAATLENLQKLLGFEDDLEVCGTASDGRCAIEEARRLRPDIVLMDVNMPHLDGLQATELMSQDQPGPPVIIMSVQGDRDYVRRAMQAGAREFLIKPFSGDELTASIRRVHQLEQRKGAFLARVADATSPLADGGTVAPQRGDVFLVFSGKGGVGKSIIASNLAIALGMETRGRVALVDLDLQFGDVGVLLDLDHPRSIVDLADASASSDAELIQDTLAGGPQGIKVLLAPNRPEHAELVTADHLRTILQELQRTFDFIVVDTASHLDELNLEAIELATRVILVAALNIPAIKDTKLSLKVMESLNVEPDRILLTLNHSDASSDLNKQAVASNLRFPIALEIPHDPRVVGGSVNRGAPFVTANPEAEVSRTIRELVSRLVPLEAPTPAEAVLGAGVRNRPRLFGFAKG